MAKYLLACSCGEELIVESAQAGQEITCQCGTKHVVPTLRHLRDLPTVEDTQPQAKSNWSARHGILAAGIIAAIVLAGSGTYFWWKSPAAPEYDAAHHTRQVEDTLETLSPTAAWYMWNDMYRNLGDTGFQEYQPPPVLVQLHNRYQVYYFSLFALAAISLIAAVVVSALPSAGGPRRRS